MIYNEKYNRFIDNDYVIYRMNTKGKLVQVKPSINNCGYEFICYKDHRIVLIHRLVYETFNGEIPEGLEIDHIDRNKHNNKPENLRLVTRSENMANRTRSDFAIKFREHFGVQGILTKHKDYNAERSWYYRNKKCRWE